MLKHIPKNFTPQMLKTFMELGHGEELLICDANFPYFTKNIHKIVTTNDSIITLLDEILYFFPLDQTVESAAIVMENAKNNGVFDSYQDVVNRYEKTCVTTLERFAFYERVNHAAAIIVSTDTTKCANIILKKGTVN